MYVKQMLEIWNISNKDNEEESDRKNIIRVIGKKCCNEEDFIIDRLYIVDGFLFTTEKSD